MTFGEVILAGTILIVLWTAWRLIFGWRDEREPPAADDSEH